MGVSQLIVNKPIFCQKEIKKGPKNLKRDIMQLFSVDAKYFKKYLLFFFDPENMKKPPSKVAHNWPRHFFFSTANRPKQAQISIPVP